MIIDLPLVPELAVGADRNIPQVGDNQVFLPASIQPVVGILTPHTVAAPTTSNQPQSCTHSAFITRTNLGALTTTLLVLPPGLYRFSTYMTMRSNYTLIGSATPDARLHIIEAGLSLFNLISFFATVGANLTMQTDSRLLLRSSSILELFIGVTGVGQTIDVAAAVNVQREL